LTRGVGGGTMRKTFQETRQGERNVSLGAAGSGRSERTPGNKDSCRGNYAKGEIVGNCWTKRPFGGRNE